MIRSCRRRVKSAMMILLSLLILRLTYSLGSGVDYFQNFDTFPSLGLGTAGLGNKNFEIVQKSILLGVNLIDTAQAREWYNEEEVGKAIKSLEAQNISTQDIVIVTKVHPRSYSYDKMDLALEKSKRNFGRSFLDVVLLHSPFCWQGHCTEEEELLTWKDGWNNLELLKQKHNISYIGVSNFDYHLLEELITQVANQKVSFVQNWMDPFHQDLAVRNLARLHNIHYMAYSSFGSQWQGSRISKENGNKNIVLSNPLLNKLTNEVSKPPLTVPQLILNWLFSLDTIAIPRSSSEAHLKENFYLLRPENRVQLSPDVLELISGLDGTMGYPWDE